MILTVLAQLNDVLSLCVGLWAVKVANRETNSKMYTYGVSLSRSYRSTSHPDGWFFSGNAQKLWVL